MSILSDRQIKNLCSEEVDHFLFTPEKGYETIYSPLFETERVNKEVITKIKYGQTYDPSRHHIVVDRIGERISAPMIRPFVPNQVREVEGRKILSYGLSSFGYDVRLSDEFKIFSNLNSSVIDPKNLDDSCLVEGRLHEDPDGSRYVILPPNSYLLGRTPEYFSIPKDVLVVAVGKSTYARSGAIVNVTPIEPGFRGNVVIEVSNSTTSPLKIYADEGIAQFLFYKGTEESSKPYDDARKYQNQTGVTLPKV